MEQMRNQIKINRDRITKTFTPIDEIEKRLINSEVYDVKVSSIYAGEDFYSCEEYQKGRKSLIVSNYKNMMLDGQRNIYDEERRCLRYSVFRDEHMIFDYYIINGKGHTWWSNDKRFQKEIEAHKAKVDCEDYRWPCNIANFIYHNYMMNPEKYIKEEKQRLQGKRMSIVVNEYQKLYDQPILLLDEDSYTSDSNMSDDPKDEDYIPDYDESDSYTDSYTSDSNMSDDPKDEDYIPDYDESDTSDSNSYTDSDTSDSNSYTDSDTSDSNSYTDSDTSDSNSYTDSYTSDSNSYTDSYTSDSNMSDDPKDEDYIPDYDECDSDDDQDILKDELINIVKKLDQNDKKYETMYIRAIELLNKLIPSHRFRNVIIERLKTIDECDNCVDVLRDSIIILINKRIE
jgi:hypothetical protein